MNSDNQYAQCKKELNKLLVLKKRLEQMAVDFQVDATPEITLLGSRIESRSRELEQYKLLSGSFTAKFPALEDIANLPTSLRKARISLHFSQTELAAQVGLKPQQISRYEKTGYTSISLAKAIAIGIVLERELKQRELKLRERNLMPA